MSKAKSRYDFKIGDYVIALDRYEDIWPGDIGEVQGFNYSINIETLQQEETLLVFVGTGVWETPIELWRKRYA